MQIWMYISQIYKLCIYITGQDKSSLHDYLSNKYLISSGGGIHRKVLIPNQLSEEIYTRSKHRNCT
jgi:hypothetical protein